MPQLKHDSSDMCVSSLQLAHGNIKSSITKRLVFHGFTINVNLRQQHENSQQPLPFVTQRLQSD
jgi:hypothetical protein